MKKKSFLTKFNIKICLKSYDKKNVLQLLRLYNIEIQHKNTNS